MKNHENKDLSYSIFDAVNYIPDIVFCHPWTSGQAHSLMKDIL